jgi:hypothetical protein
MRLPTISATNGIDAVDLKIANGARLATAIIAVLLTTAETSSGRRRRKRKTLRRSRTREERRGATYELLRAEDAQAGRGRKVAGGRLDSISNVIGCAPREGSRPAFVRTESPSGSRGGAKQPLDFRAVRRRRREALHIYVPSPHAPVAQLDRAHGYEP